MRFARVSNAYKALRAQLKDPLIRRRRPVKLHAHDVPVFEGNISDRRDHERVGVCLESVGELLSNMVLLKERLAPGARQIQAIPHDLRREVEDSNGQAQHSNGQVAQCQECGTTTSTKWRYGYTLCNACGCSLWRSGGASQAPALPPAMSSAPPEAAALVEAIAAIERGGAVPPRPLRASTAAAVAASRASLDSAWAAAALLTSAAASASAPPLMAERRSVLRPYALIAPPTLRLTAAFVSGAAGLQSPPSTQPPATQRGAAPSATAHTTHSAITVH
jgi:hypothetical protein